MKTDLKMINGQPVISSATVYLYDMIKSMFNNAITEKETRDLVTKGRVLLNGKIETNPDKVIIIGDRISLDD